MKTILDFINALYATGARPACEDNLRIDLAHAAAGMLLTSQTKLVCGAKKLFDNQLDDMYKQVIRRHSEIGNHHATVDFITGKALFTVNNRFKIKYPNPKNSDNFRLNMMTCRGEVLHHEHMVPCGYTLNNLGPNLPKYLYDSSYRCLVEGKKGLTQPPNRTESVLLDVNWGKYLSAIPISTVDLLGLYRYEFSGVIDVAQQKTLISGEKLANLGMFKVIIPLNLRAAELLDRWLCGHSVPNSSSKNNQSNSKSWAALFSSNTNLANCQFKARKAKTES